MMEMDEAHHESLRKAIHDLEAPRQEETHDKKYEVMLKTTTQMSVKMEIQWMVMADRELVNLRHVMHA